MKKIAAVIACLLIVLIVTAQEKEAVSISMGRVSLSFRVDENGAPLYEVHFAGQPVINSSRMGFRLAGNGQLETGFVITGSEKKAVDESWQPVWGEVKTIRNHYQQLLVHLRQKEAPGRLLDICFRVFEDGVGFRYIFPRQSTLRYFIVTDELTQFSLSGDHKAFWIPGDYDTNEYSYTTSSISQIDSRALV
ncbi:MAG TPA: glycoside hydrolase family 97 N-terminal domain-containing protein, partial [Chitinophagaceae bacterium]